MDNYKMLTMQDVMTPSPHTVGEEQTADVAKKFMYDLGIRHLPVLRAGKCVGLLSDRDIKLAYAVDGKKVAASLVKDICSPEVYQVTPTDSLAKVASHMGQTGLGSAVVMDGGKVVGIFTTTDACKWLGKLAS